MRKSPKLTPEELAQRAETSRLLEERIAYHEAKAVEHGEISGAVAERRRALRVAAAEAATRAEGRLTPEELELGAETQRMVEERIAYHTAKASEEEEARRAQPADG